MMGQLFGVDPASSTGLVSKEEQLAATVAPIGPMVAIGRPGERLPKPGAVRAYAGDEEWREVVDNWLSISRLVILRAGATEGLWWEIKRAFTVVGPDKIVIFMLGLKRTAYESFAKRVRTELGIELPDFNDVRSGRRASGFFEFVHDWRKPRFLPLRAPYWRTSPWKPMQRLFHQALRPVFLRLGVSWRPSPISAMRIMALGTLGFVFLCFFFVLAIDPNNLGAPPVWTSLGALVFTAWWAPRRGVRG
jgi:hypothetical protein